ncbi:MAG: MBL fold metallo-hydrolase [Terriglobales bacterium]|jgi:ribonuclease BN (tRNA processing enzyme)
MFDWENDGVELMAQWTGWWFRVTRFFLIIIVVAVTAGSSGFAEDHAAVPTRVVVLGTGNPSADPERWGPAVAVVVNDRAYLIDCGPGVVRRAAAAEKNGIVALKAKELKIVFITHLHSDHTLGYPDLIFSPWVLGRTEALEAYGPHGLKNMTSHVEKAWAEDVRIRRRGLEQANATGYKVNVHEIQPGVIYRDANVTVTAFPVKHGIWKEAYGYIFQTRDRKIVLSGDTSPTDEVVKACDGCDVLLHEVFNPHGEELKDAHWKEYFATFHTSPAELGEIARRARPKLLVLYHQSLEKLPESDLLEQMGKEYSGNWISARDLGVY